MKKFFLTIILSISTLVVFAQKSVGKLSVDDDLSQIINSLAEDYETNSFVIYDKVLSDDAVVYLNNTKMDGKTVKAAFKSHHTIFNDIDLSEYYAHTNYFSDGEVWTNNWFTWNGTGNATGLRYANKVHFDFKWENGVVVQLQAYFDPTGLNMELEAQMEME